jgi:hypothetical protein
MTDTVYDTTADAHLIEPNRRTTICGLRRAASQSGRAATTSMDRACKGAAKNPLAD